MNCSSYLLIDIGHRLGYNFIEGVNQAMFLHSVYGRHQKIVRRTKVKIHHVEIIWFGKFSKTGKYQQTSYPWTLKIWLANCRSCFAELGFQHLHPVKNKGKLHKASLHINFYLKKHLSKISLKIDIKICQENESNGTSYENWWKNQYHASCKRNDQSYKP